MENFKSLLSQFKTPENKSGRLEDYPIVQLISSIETIDEFAEFFDFLDKNIDTAVTNIEIYNVEDYIGAFSMVMKEGLSNNLSVIGMMRSELAKVAWFLYLALSTE